DARTIWLFREKLTGAIKTLFERFDAMLREAGSIAMSGQIGDASLIAAPAQYERRAIKEGRIPDEGKEKPAKLRHQGPRRKMDREVHQGQAARRRIAARRSGDPGLRLSKSHLDRSRLWFHSQMERDGRRKGLLDKTNTASGVWADTAYRSAANEAFLRKNGFVSLVHRKKPKGRAMPGAIRRANNAKSKIRSKVEHVFAVQKGRMDLFIRTIGIARATVKIGLAN